MARRLRWRWCKWGRREGLEEVAAGAAVSVGGASLSRSCFAKDGGEGKEKKKGSQHKFC